MREDGVIAVEQAGDALVVFATRGRVYDSVFHFV